MIQVSPASSSCSFSVVDPLDIRSVLRVYPHFILITAQTLESFKLLFTELYVTSDIVGLCNQEWNIIFTSGRAAAAAAVNL